MAQLLDFIFSLLRSCLRLTLFVLVSVFVLAFLALGLCAALITVLWALLTGRRPRGWATFMRMRQASRQFQQGVWRGAGHASGNASHASGSSAFGQGSDVVDVQARDVGETPAQLEQKP